MYLEDIATDDAIMRARATLQRMTDFTQTLDRSLGIARALSPMSPKVNYALKRAIAALDGVESMQDCIVYLGHLHTFVSVKLA